jgi:hypothetical protein
MRASDFSTNGILTELDVGRRKVGDIEFDIRKHVLDRMEERNVPFSTVNALLNRIPLIKNTLDTVGVGNPIWAHDPSLGISLGLRLLDSGRIQVSTAIVGQPRNKDGRYPMVTIPQS